MAVERILVTLALAASFAAKVVQMLGVFLGSKQA